MSGNWLLNERSCCAKATARCDGKELRLTAYCSSLHFYSKSTSHNVNTERTKNRPVPYSDGQCYLNVVQYYSISVARYIIKIPIRKKIKDNIDFLIFFSPLISGIKSDVDMYRNPPAAKGKR